MKIIIILFAFFVSVKGFSQDQLFKKDNSKLEVKIFEITPTEIVYKLFSYPDGPTITILKSEVVLIIYKNGVHEVINSSPQTPIVKVAPSNKDENDLNLEAKLSAKNSITFNLLEPLNGCIGLTYTRELANHYLNVCLPINIGFTAPFMNQNFYEASHNNSDIGNIANFKYSRKIVDIGLGINFQTSGQRAATYFVGPLVNYSKYNGSYDDVKQANYPNYQNLYFNHEFILERLNIMVNNGLLIKPSKNFSIILNAAFGFGKATFITNNPKQYNSNINYPFRPNSPINAFKLGMSMGYRF